KEPGADYERAFAKEALAAIEACKEFTVIDLGPGYFRPVTPQRRSGVAKFHQSTASAMYAGFAATMKKYGASQTPREQRIAELFKQAGG
ncbi:MAG: hypothetical protein WCL39_10230, partial [Armatimonadota bacterium]